MTPEQIAHDILAYIGDESLKDYGDATMISFGDAKSMIATALRQARADALEEARIEIRKRICKPDPDYDPSYWNQAVEACEFSVVSLKHKDQK